MLEYFSSFKNAAYSPVRLIRYCFFLGKIGEVRLIVRKIRYFTNYIQFARDQKLKCKKCKDSY